VVPGNGEVTGTREQEFRWNFWCLVRRKCALNVGLARRKIVTILSRVLFALLLSKLIPQLHFDPLPLRHTSLVSLLTNTQSWKTIDSAQ
jgi:hypothetical protein